MRTLKKTLSLVLVLAMVLGLCTSAFATTKFPDDASISHDEAAAVISAIGVLQGYDDGMFHPERNLTRAQAATFIARLVGMGDVGGEPTFVDVKGVSTLDWAWGAIAYCQTKGIVSGDDFEHFSPDRNVTGYEFAKMLLGALGYKADREGLTGPEWKNNVSSLLISNRLGKDLGTGFNYDAALIRDDTAQMIFNTLFATMVAYESTTTIQIGDAVLSISGDAKARTHDKANDYRDPDFLSDRDDNLQLCELYFEDLKKVDNTGEPQDDFARPNSYGWEYDDEAVIYMPQSTVVTYTKKVKEADVKKDLSAYTPEPYAATGEGWEIFVNGAQKNGSGNGTPAAAVAPGAEFYSGFDLANGSKIDYAAVADLTGNGRCVELYVNDSKEVTDVVVVEFTVGKIDSITEKSNGDVEYTVEDDDGGSQTGIIDADDADENTVVLGGEFAEDDVVTYAVGEATGTEVLYIYPTTTFTGTQDATTQSAQYGSGKVTVSGDEYTIGDAVLKTSDFTKDQNSDTETNFYRDQFGFLVYAEEVETESNYAVILRIARPASGLASAKAQALLLFTDGTTKEVTITANSASTEFTSGKLNGLGQDWWPTGPAPTPDNRDYIGEIVTYKVNDDGEYKLDDSVATVKGEVKATTGPNKAIVTEKGTPKFSVDGNTINASSKDEWAGTVEYGTNKTIYLVASGDTANTAPVWTSSGAKSNSDKYEVYTGYANVPDLRMLLNNSASVSYVKTADNGVEVVFIDVAGGSTGTSTKSKDIFYASSASLKSTGSSKIIYSLEGYINGEKATLESKDDTVFNDIINNGGRGSLYEVTYNADKQVTALDRVTDLHTVTKEAKGGTLTTDQNTSTTWACDDISAAWLIDNTDYTISKKGITDAKEHYITYIIPKDKDKAPGNGQIDTIYIFKVNVAGMTLAADKTSINICDALTDRVATLTATLPTGLTVNNATGITVTMTGSGTATVGTKSYTTGSGALSVELTGTAAGTVNVTVTVEDSEGNIYSGTKTITVVETPHQFNSLTADIYEINTQNGGASPEKYATVTAKLVDGTISTDDISSANTQVVVTDKNTGSAPTLVTISNHAFSDPNVTFRATSAGNSEGTVVLHVKVTTDDGVVYEGDLATLTVRKTD